MNNKDLKKIILVFITLLIIILFAIMIIFTFNKNKEEQMTEDGENVLEEYGKTASGGVDFQSYFDIKTCMQKYVDNINIKNSKYYLYDRTNNKVITTDEIEIKQNIYNLLSNKYIAEKNLTVENLYDNVETLQENATYLPIEVKLIQDGDIKSFLTYGFAHSTEDYSVIGKLFTIVNINVVESKFSIEPLYGDYTSINEISIKSLEETITANNGNLFNMTKLTPHSHPTEYINIYKSLALGEPERLYNLLDEEYRNERFENYDEFKNYIEKNKLKIQRARLEKYKVDVTENESRYICIDQNKNYYVINQKEMFQDYTLMLDTYTIDLPEFIQKYNSSNNNVKVALNIEKLIEATKMGDFKYIYNKLDETFKSNNYKTLADFEKFMEGKFDALEDSIKYEKYEEISGVHVYNIAVTDKSENKTINAKVVMDLKENRDFVFSFSVEN